MEPNGLAVALLLLTLPGEALATGGEYGFVWGSSPSTVSYSPGAPYTTPSDTYGHTTIQRWGPGVYDVVFPGLAEGTTGGLSGNVQVSAYGSSTNGCNVWGAWVPAGTTDAKVEIRCYTLTGQLADTQFTAMYLSHAQVALGLDAGAAYLIASRPTTPSYTTGPQLDYNSARYPNSVDRVGTGTYLVHIGAMTTAGADILVTAYSANANMCKVASTSDNWDLETADVLVLCYDSSGRQADTQFFLNYVRHTDLWYTGLSMLFDPPAYFGTAYSVVNGWTPGTIPLDPTTSWNSYNPAIGTRQRLGLGHYLIRLYDINWWSPNAAHSNALVNAYGWDLSRCRISSWYWYYGENDTQVEVSCVNSLGAPTDALFELSFQTDSWNEYY